MQCEGQRRYGGAFSFGPVKWEQCENVAVVKLFVRQDKKKRARPMPACTTCWREAKKTKGIKLMKAEPIVEASKQTVDG